MIQNSALKIIRLRLYLVYTLRYWHAIWKWKRCGWHNVKVFNLQCVGLIKNALIGRPKEAVSHWIWCIA